MVVSASTPSRPIVAATVSTPLLASTSTQVDVTPSTQITPASPDSRPQASGRALTSLGSNRAPSHPLDTDPPSIDKLKDDAESLDALFARWTHVVAQKMRTARSRKRRALKARKRAQQGSGVVPIVESVFEPVAGPSAASQQKSKEGDEEDEDPFTDKAAAAWMSGAFPPRTLDHGPPVSITEFARRVTAVREAMVHDEKPLHPRLNMSGSSGSYFCKAYIRQGEDEDAKEIAETIGIFKPKDEEPYGDMNPKWTKWAHRVLLAPIVGGFGRSCLIPNLSYLSEAGASLLDRRLQTFVVPRTEVVDISSPTFFYHWLVRKAAKRRKKPKPLPEKPGSFQLFAHGFEDASSLLRHHPWPGRALGDTLDPDVHRHPRRKRFSLYRLCCGNRFDFAEDVDEIPATSADIPAGDGTTQEGGWCWTKELMDDFRIELEKLVILDYLMRNTDRGLDNFMIKICNADCHRGGDASTTSSKTADAKIPKPNSDDCPAYLDRPHTHIAAIDNSLAFPHEHPRGWRSYPPGWLWLPVSLIGQPFSQASRDHFLPLLSSPKWWAETTLELRQLFATDADFNAKMFERQMAVIKGQGWNIVQSLLHADEGPLELWRRQKAVVWDEPVELPDTLETQKVLEAAATPRKTVTGQSLDEEARRSLERFTEPKATYGTVPMQIPTQQPSQLPRTLTADATPRPRPLPVSKGLRGMQGDFSGARGWDVMRHMEMVQAHEEHFSRSLGKRRFWSPPATERTSFGGRLTASVTEEEGEFPWGSFSEGDLRAQQAITPSSGPPAPEISRAVGQPPMFRARSSAWKDRVRERFGGAPSSKGKDADSPIERARLHRRTESAIVPGSQSIGVGHSDALSDGGLDAASIGERSPLLGDDRRRRELSASVSGDGHPDGTVLAVREHIEFVEGNAKFAC